VNDDDVRAVLDRLVDRFDDEVGSWHDVLERAGIAKRPRRILWQPRRGLALAGAAAAVVAAAISLTITSPWRGGPSIIDRAAAAILSPTSGQVLYERLAIHPARSLDRRGLPAGTVFNVQVWIDGAPPHRFRAIYDTNLPGVAQVELGGMLRNYNGFSYSPAGDSLNPLAFQVPMTPSALDPAEYIKSALTSGRAKVEGTTTIRGRKAVRIRLSARVYGPLIPIAQFFVDAHTYAPLRVGISAFLPLAERQRLPLTCVTFLFPYSCWAAPGWFYDFVEYRYLAPTTANRKLANIRAMHPLAKIV
jgi:hypothetical protein